jgi:hypothetical protein
MPEGVKEVTGAPGVPLLRAVGLKGYTFMMFLVAADCWAAGIGCVAVGSKGCWEPKGEMVC